MLIFDAHLDLAWNGVEWNRNLELPCTQIREFREALSGHRSGRLHVSFPEMHRGGSACALPPCFHVCTASRRS